MNVVVIGLGLIGGSFALALRELDPATLVTGVDLPHVLRLGAAARAAQRLVPVADSDAVDAAVASADLVLLASPVKAIVAALPRVLERARLVTDTGSTKRAITAAASASPRRGRFVAGHPMAGAPEGGVELADPALFRGRSWLVCPEGSDADAVERVSSLVEQLGARPISLNVLAHDRAVALTSHVTQLVASALAAVAAETGAWPAAGPAFEGATRVAGGPAEIWADILATNADAVADGLGAIIDELTTVREGLGSGPPDIAAARALLERARRARRH